MFSRNLPRMATSGITEKERESTVKWRKSTEVETSGDAQNLVTVKAVVTCTTRLRVFIGVTVLVAAGVAGVIAGVVVSLSTDENNQNQDMPKALQYTSMCQLSVHDISQQFVIEMENSSSPQFRKCSHNFCSNITKVLDKQPGSNTLCHVDTISNGSVKVDFRLFFRKATAITKESIEETFKESNEFQQFLDVSTLDILNFTENAKEQDFPKLSADTAKADETAGSTSLTGKPVSSSWGSSMNDAISRTTTIVSSSAAPSAPTNSTGFVTSDIVDTTTNTTRTIESVPSTYTNASATTFTTTDMSMSETSTAAGSPSSTDSFTTDSAATASSPTSVSPVTNNISSTVESATTSESPTATSSSTSAPPSSTEPTTTTDLSPSASPTTTTDSPTTVESIKGSDSTTGTASPTPTSPTAKGMPNILESMSKSASSTTKAFPTAERINVTVSTRS